MTTSISSGRDACRLKVFYQHRLIAINCLALLAEFAADPGLDQHIVTASANQQGIQAHSNLVAFVGSDSFLP